MTDYVSRLREIANNPSLSIADAWTLIDAASELEAKTERLRKPGIRWHQTRRGLVQHPRLNQPDNWQTLKGT